MDMARTSVNVLGKYLASAVVARWEGFVVGGGRPTSPSQRPGGMGGLLRLNGRAMPTAGWDCRCLRRIRQEPQRTVHRFRIAKHLHKFRIDQHEVGSGGCLPVVLAAYAPFQLGEVVLRA
jgi:hypothetical protein